MKSTFSCCGVASGGRAEELNARIDQSEIGLVYDKLAKIYDIWGRLTESRARDRAIELADIADGQNVLEVAVGTGLAFLEIVKRNPHGTNTGIDLSNGMLEKAKKRLRKLQGANYTLTIGSAFTLPVDSGSVDILVNNYMFDLIHFTEMDVVLDEFKRALKPGGKLILINMTKGERFGSGLYDRVYNLSPRLMGGCRGVSLAGRLEDHGFHVVSREYYQQLLFPSEVILAHR